MTNGESEFESRGFTDGYEADYISVQCVVRRFCNEKGFHHRGYGWTGPACFTRSSGKDYSPLFNIAPAFIGANPSGCRLAVVF